MLLKTLLLLVAAVVVYANQQQDELQAQYASRLRGLQQAALIEDAQRRALLQRGLFEGLTTAVGDVVEGIPIIGGLTAPLVEMAEGFGQTVDKFVDPLIGNLFKGGSGGSGLLGGLFGR